jgi:hypothetical protein
VIERGAIDVKSIVTATIPLARVMEAAQAVADRTGIGAVITFGNRGARGPRRGPLCPNTKGRAGSSLGEPARPSPPPQPSYLLKATVTLP